MSNSGLKRKLGWVEAGLYLGGVVLLAVFFQIRAEGERQRELGIEAFRQAVDSQVVLQDQVSGESLSMTVTWPSNCHRAIGRRSSSHR